MPDAVAEPVFIPGRELSRRFYWEAVRPLLDVHYPGLPHAAALIGPGSEVLGFDTAMSMDHDWYPGLVIFLSEAVSEAEGDLKSSIREMLSRCLPHVFLGFPVDRVEHENEPGTHRMALKQEGPVDHAVFPVTVRQFVQKWLAWDIRQPLTAVDWLTFPAQVLRSITAGTVHYDGTGEITGLQERLAWYPHDVWLYLLACGWARIGEEEHLMGRAGFVGDELGSAVIGARLVRDTMHLAFLMARQYPPYPKWFGSAFQQLDCAGDLSVPLWQAVRAETWPEREAALLQAWEYLAGWQNRLQLTRPLPEAGSYFFNRPFKVIDGGRFASALCAQVRDEQVLAVCRRGLIGSIDQFSDSTSLRSDISWRSGLAALYTEEMPV